MLELVLIFMALAGAFAAFAFAFGILDHKIRRDHNKFLNDMIEKSRKSKY